jgi:tetratricopeptide (TPR) repeat protein
MAKKVTPIDKIDLVINLLNNGNFNDANEIVENLIKKYPNDSILLNIAGACNSGMGKLDIAASCYKKAILINPDFADFHYNLGNVLNDIGKPYEAIDSFKKVLQILPDNSIALFNLGVTLQKLGKLDEAVNYYELASKANPEDSDIKVNLGIAYQEFGQFDDAIEQYKLAIKINPKAIEALNNLGIIHRQIDQADKSIKYYKDALNLDPDDVGSHYNLGFAYQDLGQVAKAIYHYEKAIEHGNHSWSFHNLSYLKEFKSDDPLIFEMESLLINKKIEALDRIHLCLGLAKIHESLGDEKKFFYFLNKGNGLRKIEMSYSSNETKIIHSTIKKIFTDSEVFIKKPEKNQLLEKRPIFIVGMPRSGTSLVEQILASHNSVYGAGELDQITKLTLPIIKNFLNGDIKQVSKQAIDFINSEYQNTLSYFNSSASVITDKLPLNFQYIGFILSAFPNAKIVHLKRDARATCWSNYKYFFTSKDNGYSHDFNDLANFYKSYIDLMGFWHKLYPEKIYDLDYETLTLNQESETRKLLEYCELDWDKNCLKFYENSRAVRTISALQVRKKMYQGSSKSWKKYSSHIQPLINALEKY